METEVYYEAAEILRKAKEKRATLKTLIYASQYKNIRQLFALVNECMKYKSQLEEVLSNCPSTFQEEEIVGNDRETALVLLYEHLLGRKFGRAATLRRFFHGYKGAIKNAVDKVLTKYGVETLQEVQAGSNGTVMKIPRYMRVNLIKSSVEGAVEDLKAEGWDFVGKLDSTNFKTGALSLNKYQFGLDPFLFDLLVFPVDTDLHDHELTQTGVLVQQDRASCIPAHTLSPSRGSVVLDCCAAPGNKTSHLASLMKDDGRVIALDRDFKRMTTMSHLLERSGATSVELIHQDFLTVQPNSDDAENINMILVDPSCSGSGMLGAQSGQDIQVSDDSRIQSLKRFQISILKHALRFPNVERVAYSTCSIHQEENEQVVEEVMSQVSDFFQFRPLFREWRCSRGLAGFPHANFFLRLSPQQDLTQGFFVACFERVKKKEKKSLGNEIDKDEMCFQNNFDDEGEEMKSDDTHSIPISKSVAIQKKNGHKENKRISKMEKKKKDSVASVTADVEPETKAFTTDDENSLRRKKKKIYSVSLEDDSNVPLQENSETLKTKNKIRKKKEKTSKTEISIEPGLLAMTHSEGGERVTNISKKKKHKDKRKGERGWDGSETSELKVKKRKYDRITEDTEDISDSRKKKRKNKNITGENDIISDSEIKKKKRKIVSVLEHDKSNSACEKKNRKRKEIKDLSVTGNDLSISESKTKKKRTKED